MQVLWSNWLLKYDERVPLIESCYSWNGRKVNYCPSDCSRRQKQSAIFCTLCAGQSGVTDHWVSCFRLSFSLFFLLSLSLSLHFVLLRGSVRIGWSRTETAVGRISTDFASSCVGTDQGWTTRLRHRLQELENSAFMVYDPMKVQTSFPVVKMNQNQYWLISAYLMRKMWPD